MAMTDNEAAQKYATMLREIAKMLTMASQIPEQGFRNDAQHLMHAVSCLGRIRHICNEGGFDDGVMREDVTPGPGVLDSVDRWRDLARCHCGGGGWNIDTGTTDDSRVITVVTCKKCGASFTSVSALAPEPCDCRSAYSCVECHENFCMKCDRPMPLAQDVKTVPRWCPGDIAAEAVAADVPVQTLLTIKRRTRTRAR